MSENKKIGRSYDVIIEDDPIIPDVFKKINLPSSILKQIKVSSFTGRRSIKEIINGR